AGDVILSIGGETVEGPRQAISALYSKAGTPVEVKIMRDRQEQTVTLQVERRRTVTGHGPIQDGEVFGPFEFGPFDLQSIVMPAVQIASPVVVTPRIQIAPVPPVVAPSIQIAPMPPIVLPQINIAPIAVPSAVPRIVMPRIVVPAVQIMIPFIRYRVEV